MKDFTLNQYEAYIKAIKDNYSNVLLFREYMANPVQYSSFCLIRHDVDRKVQNALEMAKLEKDLGIKSTYYFRAKEHVFEEKIICKINDMGHEIGYHYECLSDTNGNMDKAYVDFEKNLKRFRSIVNVDTISMHGRPLSKYDNRDMWRHERALGNLNNLYNILGEIYLHIDYTDIAYIGDTGRNWNSGKSNKRDHVNSEIDLIFNSGEELLRELKSNPPKKLVFQIHPERWTNNAMQYNIQLAKDTGINIIKKFL